MFVLIELCQLVHSVFLLWTIVCSQENHFKLSILDLSNISLIHFHIFSQQIGSLRFFFFLSSQWHVGEIKTIQLLHFVISRKYHSENMSLRKCSHHFISLNSINHISFSFMQEISSAIYIQSISHSLLKHKFPNRLSLRETASIQVMK